MEYRSKECIAANVLLERNARNPTHIERSKAPPNNLYGTHAREGGKNKKIHARAIKEGRTKAQNKSRRKSTSA